MDHRWRRAIGFTLAGAAALAAASRADTPPTLLPEDRKLNPQEVKLLQESPLVGLRVLGLAKLAVEESSRRYTPAACARGNGDAFRHAFWSVLMTAALGADIAERWSTAHEEGQAGNRPIDRQMDLHNNHLGRALCPADADWSDPELPTHLAHRVQAALRAGHGVIVHHGRLIRSSAAGEKPRPPAP